MHLRRAVVVLTPARGQTAKDVTVRVQPGEDQPTATSGWSSCRSAVPGRTGSRPGLRPCAASPPTHRSGRGPMTQPNRRDKPLEGGGYEVAVHREGVVVRRRQLQVAADQSSQMLLVGRVLVVRPGGRDDGHQLVGPVLPEILGVLVVDTGGHPAVPVVVRLGPCALPMRGQDSNTTSPAPAGHSVRWSIESKPSRVVHVVYDFPRSPGRRRRTVTDATDTPRVLRRAASTAP